MLVKDVKEFLSKCDDDDFVLIETTGRGVYNLLHITKAGATTDEDYFPGDETQRCVIFDSV